MELKKKKKKLGNRPKFLSLLYPTDCVIGKLRQVTFLYAPSSMKWEEWLPFIELLWHSDIKSCLTQGGYSTNDNYNIFFKFILWCSVPTPNHFHHHDTTPKENILVDMPLFQTASFQIKVCEIMVKLLSLLSTKSYLVDSWLYSYKSLVSWAIEPVWKL